MGSVRNLPADRITRVLTYAGFVLSAFEIIKEMIVPPINSFYRDTTFGEGSPFKSYEEDVLFRHKNEFEACLLYLRDFMEAIDGADVLTIQALRKHRNDLAHDLVDKLSELDIQARQTLFEDVKRTLFKISNYRAYMEIGADPEFRDVNWEAAKGGEYLLFEAVVAQVRLLELLRPNFSSW